MKNEKTIRVAATQMAAGTDVDQNLQTCLRVLDKAAEHKPDLVVLPEFCNHLSWYDGPEHCYEVSVEEDGPFLKAIAEKAKAHGFHVVVNVTVRRGESAATGTSFLFDDQGHKLASSDKQVLMGHESNFLKAASEVCPIVNTAVGRLGLYACMDGVIAETPRNLALGGAQVLCNSLNSFAADEGSLHVPVRGPENRVFIVASNKVGPLIPEALLGPVSEGTGIPEKFLYGAGDSQIVAPDGTVIAHATTKGEEIVIADIDPSLADTKVRPDGTDVFAARRPELYSPLAQDPAQQTSTPVASESIDAMVVVPEATGAAAIDEVARAVAAASTEGVRLVVLPELVGAEDAASNTAAAAALGLKLVEAIRDAARPGTYVATTIVAEHEGVHRHRGVLVGSEGVVLTQDQLHACGRHLWAKPGDKCATIDLPFARVALVVGGDTIYPEAYRLAAIAGAEVVLSPTKLVEAWEMRTGLPERAAENRVCLVAASRPLGEHAGLVATLHKDFTLLTQWETRPFDGEISAPIVTAVSGRPGRTRGTLDPQNSTNKVLSNTTDVLRSRPHALLTNYFG